MPEKFSFFIKRFLLIFSIGFVLTMPNSYYFFPDIGTFLSSGIKLITRAIFSIEGGELYSDSALMYAWLVLLFFFSLLISLGITIFSKTGNLDRLNYWLNRFSAYYLALSLFQYGFNKIFKYQFFFPEPNTLYTPLGQLSPDILYWSAIGTSYSYNLLGGLFEVIPAFLLLFKRTRMLGALIAVGVMAHVLMINFGFNISVKLYSGFLLLMALIILLPWYKRLYTFFFTDNAIPTAETKFQPGKRFNQYYPIIKPLVIGLILFESLGMYFAAGYFNGDEAPKPLLYGAYGVEGEESPKRIFFHSRNYFIVQTHEDTFKDYKLKQDLSQQLLIIEDYKGEQAILHYSHILEDNLMLRGYFFGPLINWQLIKENTEALPIHQSGFNWISK